jgi:hypothetical protein
VVLSRSPRTRGRRVRVVRSRRAAGEGSAHARTIARRRPRTSRSPRRGRDHKGGGVNPRTPIARRRPSPAFFPVPHAPPGRGVRVVRSRRAGAEGVGRRVTRQRSDRSVRSARSVRSTAPTGRPSEPPPAKTRIPSPQPSFATTPAFIASGSAGHAYPTAVTAG